MGEAALTVEPTSVTLGVAMSVWKLPPSSSAQPPAVPIVTELSAASIELAREAAPLSEPLEMTIVQLPTVMEALPGQLLVGLSAPILASRVVSVRLTSPSAGQGACPHNLPHREKKDTATHK